MHAAPDYSQRVSCQRSADALPGYAVPAQQLQQSHQQPIACVIGARPTHQMHSAVAAAVVGTSSNFRIAECHCHPKIILGVGHTDLMSMSY